MLKRTKAISESITTLILIGITLLAGYIIYRGYTIQVSSAQTGIREASEVARARIAEKIDIVDAYIDVTTNNLTIIIYNYGFEDINVREILVPILINGTILSMRIFRAYDEPSISNPVIKRRNLTKIVININQTASDLPPEDRIVYPAGLLVKIAMFTDSGRKYEFYAYTVNPRG